MENKNPTHEQPESAVPSTSGPLEGLEDHPPCPFPQPTRLVTGHDPSTREAVFDDTFAPKVDPHVNMGFVFYHCYTLPSITLSSSSTSSHGTDIPATSNLSPSPTLPATITTNTDLSFYASQYPKMQSLDLPAGAVFHFLDFPPGAISPMHRTQTVDFGFVMEGAVEAVMDSGETRRMERGSMIVQRGTMHGWREATGTQWARVGFVMLGMGTERIKVPAAGGERKEGDDAGEGWRAKKAAASSGAELKAWIPWEQEVPGMEMAAEVIATIEKGKKKEEMKATG